MHYEASAFADLVQNNQVEHSGLERARLVSEVLTEARKQVGVVFPADQSTG